MVLFTDPICLAYREEHLAFNRKLISLLCDTESRYYWSGDQEYGEELFAGFRNVGHIPLIYHEKFTLKEGIRRYRHIFRTIKRTKEAQSIIFLSFENTLFPIFCIIFSRMLSRKRIICVLHNNLKTLKESRFKKSLLRIAGSLTRVRYVVLTESMKGYADQILDTQSYLLYHPFYDIPHKRSNDATVNFLAIGNQGLHFYGSGLYNEFITACNKLCPNENIKMVIVVPGKSGIQSFQNGSVETKIISGFIANHEYYEYLQDTNFVIFPLLDDSQYRASGTLIDTLSAGLIFIAPETGHFKEFQGCGIFYRKSNFKDAIIKAVNLTHKEQEEMKKMILKKRNEYETTNKRVLKNQLI